MQPPRARPHPTPQSEKTTQPLAKPTHLRPTMHVRASILNDVCTNFMYVHDNRVVNGFYQARYLRVWQFTTVREGFYV